MTDFPPLSGGVSDNFALSMAAQVNPKYRLMEPTAFYESKAIDTTPFCTLPAGTKVTLIDGDESLWMAKAPEENSSSIKPVFAQIPLSKLSPVVSVGVEEIDNA